MSLSGSSPDTNRHKRRILEGDRDDNDSNRMKPEPDSDIKDYAETTMNELLGWYGLDKLDTRGLNLKSLNHHFQSSSSSSSPQRNEDESEDDLDRSPFIESESLISNPSNETIVCAWCLKSGLKLFTLKTASGKTKVFCSEPCFNQCRRAAFKQNRVCNWCRHVRHTVNYVDFKDGDEQLQFCSDKCLNQYKMQIFCRETQAYLQMNPHLQEESHKNANNANSKLITPDLWLRDCHEPTNGGIAQSVSNSDEEPASPNIRTPVSSTANEVDLEDLSLKNKQEKVDSVSLLQKERIQEIHKNTENAPSIKDKRSVDICNGLSSYLREDKTKNILDRRKRHFENDREYFRKKQRMANIRHRINHHHEAPPAHMASVHAPSITFPGQSRLFQPSVSPYLFPNAPNSLTPPAAHTKHTAASLLNPSLPPPPPLLTNEILHSQFNSQIFQPHVTSIPHQQQLEAFFRIQSTLNRRTDSFPSNPFSESTLTSPRATPSQFATGTSLQSNTVMLPYPIFLPLPVPIPIPIPLSNFLKISKKETGTNEKQSDSCEPIVNGEKEMAKLSDGESDNTPNPVLNKSKNIKSDANDNLIRKEKFGALPDTSSYAITNNDSQTNRLILTRNKKR